MLALTLKRQLHGKLPPLSILCMTSSKIPNSLNDISVRIVIARTNIPVIKMTRLKLKVRF